MKIEVPPRREWLEGAMLAGFFLAGGATYFAVMTLWQEREHVTSVVLAIAFLGFLGVVFLRELERERFRSLLEHAVKDLDAAHEAIECLRRAAGH